MGADFGKSRGEGGHTANPFLGGGMDIFWNHTIIRSIYLCSCVSMSRFRMDLNPISDGLTLLVIKMRLLAQISYHVSNIVMLTINSRSLGEMILGFNLTVRREERRQGMKLCSRLRTICDST